MKIATELLKQKVAGLLQYEDPAVGDHPMVDYFLK